MKEKLLKPQNALPNCPRIDRTKIKKDFKLCSLCRKIKHKSDFWCASSFCKPCDLLKHKSKRARQAGRGVLPEFQAMLNVVSEKRDIAKRCIGMEKFLNEYIRKIIIYNKRKRGKICYVCKTVLTQNTMQQSCGYLCKKCGALKAMEIQRKYFKANAKYNRYGLVGKKCFVCKSWKPINQFNINRYRRDGFQGLCNTCLNERKRRRRELYLGSYPREIFVANSKVLQCKDVPKEWDGWLRDIYLLKREMLKLTKGE